MINILISNSSKSGDFAQRGVQFETKRVFDNEVWYINNNKIKSKGLNGECKNYVLEKNR